MVSKEKHPAVGQATLEHVTRPYSRPSRPQSVRAHRTTSSPGRSRTRAASSRRCTGAGSGPCASMRASASAADSNAAVPVPPLPGRDRPERRVRSAHADGIRLRPSARGGRGRTRRRGDRLARRHDDALRRHPARRRVDVDDHQRDGGDPARALRRRREAAGRAARSAVGHDPERHPEGVHRARHLHLSAAALAAHRHRHLRVVRGASCRTGTRFPSAATTSAKPARRRCRKWRSRSPTPSPTSRPRARRASSPISSVSGSRSSSPRTTISSRRSRSSARRAGCGRTSCVTGSAPATRGRCRCAFTRRRPAARSPRSSRTTTSCAWPSSRSPPCWAARSRCTQRPGRGAGAADRRRRADCAAHAADHRRGNRRRQHGRPVRRRLGDRAADR